MYNAEYKMKFLKESSDTERYKSGVEVISTYFNLSEIMENALKKDVANFTLDEIVDFYKSICTSSEEYLATVNCQLSAYCEWNRKQGLSVDNQNHFEEITRDILSQCINRSIFKSQFITRGELYSIINSGRIENISDAFLMLALFEGICGSAYIEILELTPSDFNGNIVKLCSGRTLEVSDKLVQLAMESAKTFDFQLNNRLCKFPDDDMRCFKMYRRNIDDRNRKFVVIRRLVALKDRFNCNALGGKELMESGRLEMIKDYMGKHNCDLMKCLDDAEFKKEMEFRYGTLQSKLSYARKIKILFEE